MPFISTIFTCGRSFLIPSSTWVGLEILDRLTGVWITDRLTGQRISEEGRGWWWCCWWPLYRCKNCSSSEQKKGRCNCDISKSLLFHFSLVNSCYYCPTQSIIIWYVIAMPFIHSFIHWWVAWEVVGGGRVVRARACPRGCGGGSGAWTKMAALLILQIAPKRFQENR